MKGPRRGHVRDTTALPWERTVTIFAVMTHKLHLCVRPSQLGTQGGFHLSALLCETTPATIRRPSTPTTISIGGTLHVSALLCHHRSHRRHRCHRSNRSNRSHRSHPLGAKRNPSPSCHAKHLLSVNLRNRNRLSLRLNGNPSARSPSVSILCARRRLLDLAVSLGVASSWT